MVYETIFLKPQTGWMDGWMDTCRHTDQHQEGCTMCMIQTSGCCWERGLVGRRVWRDFHSGESRSLLMWDHVTVSAVGAERTIAKWWEPFLALLPSACSCNCWWLTSSSANCLCCSFLSKGPFFLPCLCLAKPNSLQPWHLFQLSRLLAFLT